MICLKNDKGNIQLSTEMRNILSLLDDIMITTFHKVIARFMDFFAMLVPVQAQFTQITYEIEVFEQGLHAEGVFLLIDVATSSSSDDENCTKSTITKNVPDRSTGSLCKLPSHQKHEQIIAV